MFIYQNKSQFCQSSCILVRTSLIRECTGICKLVKHLKHSYDHGCCIGQKKYLIKDKVMVSLLQKEGTAPNDLLSSLSSSLLLFFMHLGCSSEQYIYADPTSTFEEQSFCFIIFKTMQVFHFLTDSLNPVMPDRHDEVFRDGSLRKGAFLVKQF